MPTRILDVYSTREDWIALFGEWRQADKIVLVGLDVYNSDLIPCFNPVEELPELGRSPTGVGALDPQYLIVPISIDVVPRPVKQTDGIVRWFSDQLATPDSIALSPGGLHESGCLIRVTVWTTTDSRVSKNLFESFKRLIKKRFTSVDRFYVGPETMKLLSSGFRLTGSIRQPAKV